MPSNDPEPAVCSDNALLRGAGDSHPHSTAPLILHVFSTFAIGGPQVRFAALANSTEHRFRHLVLAMDGRYDCLDRIRAECFGLIASASISRAAAPP